MKPELIRLLLITDSPQKYYPVGLDIGAELERARSLADEISRSTLLSTIVEDPSYFQDGSLFCRIIIEKNGSGKAGEVLLSSFGNLATIDETSRPVADEVVKALKAHGYVYVQIDSLDVAYSGEYQAFKRSTWLNRHFSSFHVIDPT